MNGKIIGVINRLLGLGKIISTNGKHNLKIELLPGEIKNRIKYIQQRGFASIPKPNDKALCLFIGGHRACGLVIAIEDNEGIKELLQEGDACLYADINNYLRMDLAKGEAILKTKELLLNDEKILKAIEQIRKDLQTIKTQYNGHNHGANGGAVTTSQIGPVGVKP